MSLNLGPATRRLAAAPTASGLAGPLGVAAVAVSAVAFVGAVDPGEPGHYPTCPFLALTGLLCPGCGSLRAVHALTGGDVAAALGLNPLTVAVLPLLVGAWLAWLVRSATGRPRRWLAPPAALWALVVLVCAFWVLRNVPAFAAVLAP